MVRVFLLLPCAFAVVPPNQHVGGVPAKGGWRGSTLTDKTSLQYESGYGHELHLFRVFGWANCRNFNDDEIAFAGRGGLLWYSIQPTDWAKAAQDEVTIKRCASVIKTMGDKNVYVSVGHEPDIHCDKSGSHDYWGSPSDYQAMWATFQAVFKAEGVTNVLWTLDFSRNTGYPLTQKTSSWSKVEELWPGDGMVDWLFFNIFSDQPVGSPAYAHRGDFTAQLKSIYGRLESNTARGHNYTSATWGVGAFGAMEHQWGGAKISDADRSAFIDAAGAALDSGSYPRIRALNWFDSNADNDCTITNGMMPSYKNYLSNSFFSINDQHSDSSVQV